MPVAEELFYTDTSLKASKATLTANNGVVRANPREAGSIRIAIK